MVGPPQNVKEMTVNTIQLLDKKQSLEDIAAKRRQEAEEENPFDAELAEMARAPAVQREYVVVSKPPKESPKHSPTS